MKPRVTLITIGVDDLERALHFYRDGLGFRSEGIVGEQFEHGAVAFFELQPGLKLATWPRKSLAHDTTSTPAGLCSTTTSTWAEQIKVYLMNFETHTSTVRLERWPKLPAGNRAIFREL